MPKSSALPSIPEIARVTGVAEVTVRSTAAGMYPYASGLIPPTYASRDTTAKVIQQMQADPS